MPNRIWQIATKETVGHEKYKHKTNYLQHTRISGHIITAVLCTLNTVTVNTDTTESNLDGNICNTEEGDKILHSLPSLSLRYISSYVPIEISGNGKK